MKLRQNPIGRPGQGPAAFAFLDPGPPLRSFTKNINPKAKPSASISPSLDLRAEDFAQPMSSEPAPSHRPWIGNRARPQQAEPYPIMPVTKLHKGEQNFLASCTFVLAECDARQVKQTREHRNACAEGANRGCSSSTEFVIVVPRASWRNIFSEKRATSKKARSERKSDSNPLSGSCPKESQNLCPGVGN